MKIIPSNFSLLPLQRLLQAQFFLETKAKYYSRKLKPSRDFFPSRSAWSNKLKFTSRVFFTTFSQTRLTPFFKLYTESGRAQLKTSWKFNKSYNLFTFSLNVSPITSFSFYLLTYTFLLYIENQFKFLFFLHILIYFLNLPQKLF